jgi:hypothetical protein
LPKEKQAAREMVGFLVDVWFWSALALTPNQRVTEFESFDRLLNWTI